ncbi:MAG: polyprenyl synthetase family protein [Agathobacter sp.]|nr:polyprenyl synthetase family protein [Agathobacter sp.]
MNIREELARRAEQFNTVIASYLPKEEGMQKTIYEAMNYSLLVGGKRLRPILMEETYQMFSSAYETENGRDVIESFMSAMEMIHTYSLVHDDLPAMDNDEYRRGKKTTHAVYGETMGILAGDALLNYAFETATNAFDKAPLNAKIAKALQILSQKAGAYGMIGGQVVDIETENMEASQVTIERLEYIHLLKTAALIESSLMIGAVLGGAPEEDVKALEQIGRKVGVAFQIQDDILDVTSTMEVLGKPIGSDEKNNKVTYVTLVGLEKAQQAVTKLSKEAVELMDGLSVQSEFLSEVILYLIHREK